MKKSKLGIGEVTSSLEEESSSSSAANTDLLSSSSAATDFSDDSDDADVEEENYQWMSGEILFPEGALKNAVSRNVPILTVLSAQEESDIRESKTILSEIILDLKNKKDIYLTMLQVKKEPNIAIAIKIRTGSDENERSITLKDIHEMCITSRKNALEYIDFLKSKAAKLLAARDHARAKLEFKAALDYSIEVFGADHIETLTTQLDYGIAIISQDDTLNRHLVLKGTLEKLEVHLASPDCNNNIKRAVAISDDAIAQYYMSQHDIAAAILHLNRSESLRQQYNAPESELDKIRYLQATIAYQSSDYDKADKLLLECYKFRNDKNKLGDDLIPVLELLSGIKNIQKKYDIEMILLTQLLEIQRYLNIEPRKIITTQLQMLKAMRYKVVDNEFWEVMASVTEQLNNIPINAESFAVGENYCELIDARIGAPIPSDWSNVKRREYEQKTLGLIHKAKAHLRVATNSQTLIASDWMKQLDNFQDSCQMAIQCSSDPTFAYKKNEPLHPDDQEELETLNGEVAHELTTTQEELIKLSEFSSEVRHSLVDPQDKLLTIEEFELLPENGLINPYKLRAAQGGINKEFRDGKSLVETRESLITDPNYTNQIPAIEIGIHNGQVYSFDTRRLIIHQQAKEQNINVEIRYKKISGAHLQNRVDAIYSPRPWNGIVTALRFGGKGSESNPYINPAFKPQLEETVEKTFKKFPSDRHGADDNGFPITQKQAKKIGSFFNKKANNGSLFAAECLNEAKRISQEEGREAAYLFLINKKSEINLKPN